MNELYTRKSPNPNTLYENKDLIQPLKVILDIFHLSDMYRNGWLRPGRDIPKELCETIAEHKLGMLLIVDVISITYNDEILAQTGGVEIDWWKVTRIIKWHDFSEVRSEDYIPDDLKPEEKYRKEKAALYESFNPTQFKEAHPLIKLWQEFEEGKTREARIARDVDYFQRSVKALIYEKLLNKDLSSFYTKREDKFYFSIFSKLFKMLL